MGMIRNISQTAQEREIIKTAPDLVVYLEGLPYLINEFLSTSQNSPTTLVNFNDHVTGFTASYAVDNWIPQCSISLSVPNHLKHLYQIPGGVNLIQTMMEVQVYAKGYYLANNGNTLYRRVFKGLVSHVSFQDDGKSLAISVQCSGVLQFLAMMQIDIHPAVMTNSQYDAQEMQTVFSNLNPYQQLVAMFLTSIYTDGFQINSFNTFAQTQKKGAGSSNEEQSPYFNAIKNGFVAKWQAISQKLGQDVHIYGVTNKEVSSTIDELKRITIRGKQGSQDLNFRAVGNMYQGAKSESDAQSEVDVVAIRKHQPEMTPAGIQLLNGQIINRLDRLRMITSSILFEGYQDVDGQIIIKPPMYNLDVTNLGLASSNAAKKFQKFPSTDINTHNNPFIINLAEILTENETEDQAAVRVTRMVVQGTWDTQLGVKGPSELRAAAEYVDLQKLSQFGLREEPAKSINWLTDDDHEGVFAYAASELVRANRGYRTYTVTIPMRPELKLGFPCFIPHKDMYGYINNITLNYQMGGDATMTVSMDTLRKRPMFPRPNTSVNQDTGEVQTTGGVVYATQPNLVYKWTQVPIPSVLSTAVNSPTPNFGSSLDTPPAAPAPNSVSDPNVSGSSLGDDVSITKAANDTTTSNDDIKVINYRQVVLGTYLTMKADTKTNNWNIQNDDVTTTIESVPVSIAGQPASPGTPVTHNTPGGVFVNPRSVDVSYYHDLFAGTMPYTDAKGYEVVAPFPWGRYTDLKTALWDFTQLGYVESTAASNEDTLTLQNVNSFLFAGLETPSTSGSTSASDLTTALNKANAASSPGNSTIIELSYTSSLGASLISLATSLIDDSTLLTQPQPDNNQQLDNQLIQNTVASEQAKVAVFVSGGSVDSATSTQDSLALKDVLKLTETGAHL